MTCIQEQKYKDFDEDDETILHDGIGKSFEPRDEEIPTWLTGQFSFVDSCQGLPYCSLVKSFFKEMILEGCPLEVLSRLTNSHINTVRRWREDLKYSAPTESWLRRDLRNRAGSRNKELASTNWMQRATGKLIEMIRWCERTRCKNPKLCYESLRESGQIILLDLVKNPFRKVDRDTDEVDTRRVSHTHELICQGVSRRKGRSNQEERRNDCLDEYIGIKEG